MNRETFLVAGIALIIGVVAWFCFGVTDDYGWHTGMNYERYEQYDDKRLELDERPSVTGGNPMGHSMHMNMMVASEKDFIENMIPHHQEAIDTAKEVIERGATTPLVRALVENIIVAQEKEIADMKRWYQSWYGKEYQDTGTYMPMMRDLAMLSGIEIDRAFLEDMIPHHRGAIMMANSVQSHIEHQEISELTSAIVTTQSAEIIQMQQLLSNL